MSNIELRQLLSFLSFFVSLPYIPWLPSLRHTEKGISLLVGRRQITDVLLSVFASE